MAVHIWRNRRREAAGTTAEQEAAPAPKAVADEPAPAPTRTVVVERRAPGRWVRRTRHNPLSALIWVAGWVAALILLLGILLTWGNANTGNAIVDATLDAGRWLATPFRDVFTNANPKHQLYQNWGLAAAVYYVLGRVLSWLTRF